MSGIRAILFDFDGLILDTETPEYESWREICVEHGVELPLDEWVRCVGASFDLFHPADHLEQNLGRKVDREALHDLQRVRHREMLAESDLMPGVRSWLQDARDLGMACAVASSSRHTWVDHHLVNYGIAEYFQCVRCRDDVERVKPAPDLFLAAAECVGIAPENCLVLEDSPNGVRAAHAAGMRVVGVPNGITAKLDMSAADVVAASLGETSLRDVLAKLG